MKLPFALGLIALAALPAGCTTLGMLAPVANPINQTEVYQLGNAYGLAQALAVGYAALPLCPPGTVLSGVNWCRDKAVTALLARDDAAARTAYLALVGFVRDPQNYPGLSFTRLLSTARDALAVIAAIETAYNIGKAS